MRSFARFAPTPNVSTSKRETVLEAEDVEKMKESGHGTISPHPTRKRPFVLMAGESSVCVLLTKRVIAGGHKEGHKERRKSQIKPIVL